MGFCVNTHNIEGQRTTIIKSFYIQSEKRKVFFNKKKIDHCSNKRFS